MTMFRCWLRGKRFQLMVLLGLRIDPEWLLLRELIRKYGEDEAQAAYAGGLLLDIEFNGIPTKKRIGNIVDATQPKLLEEQNEDNQQL